MSGNKSFSVILNRSNLGVIMKRVGFFWCLMLALFSWLMPSCKEGSKKIGKSKDNAPQKAASKNSKGSKSGSNISDDSKLGAKDDGRKNMSLTSAEVKRELGQACTSPNVKMVSRGQVVNEIIDPSQDRIKSVYKNFMSLATLHYLNTSGDKEVYSLGLTMVQFGATADEMWKVNEFKKLFRLFESTDMSKVLCFNNKIVYYSIYTKTSLKSSEISESLKKNRPGIQILRTPVKECLDHRCIEFMIDCFTDEKSNMVIYPFDRTIHYADINFSNFLIYIHQKGIEQEEMDKKNEIKSDIDKIR